MKSLRNRGALIIEYALLMFVCCILGVIYLNSAPDVRDGVEPIKIKTEKVLADANNSIKGDKPAQEGNKPGEDGNKPSLGPVLVPVTDTVDFMAGQSYQSGVKTSELASGLKDSFWHVLSTSNTDAQSQKYGGKEDVRLISWDSNGNLSVTTEYSKDGQKKQYTYTTSGTFENGEFINNAVGNRGFALNSSGSLVFDENNQLLKNDASGNYTNFVLNNKNGTQTIVDYRQ